jgi:hypothetical protein
VGLYFVLYAIKIIYENDKYSSMAYFAQYPTGAYASEQPLWVNFYAAPYSLKNFERTRSGIINRSYALLKLPLPKEPGFMARHEFGQADNPVGPVFSMAGVANAGGFGNFDTLFDRSLQPAQFYTEKQFATSTYRRFSNITEYSMISEARKSYQFDYIFAPHNEADSLAVENIVASFRKFSYPFISTYPERTAPQSLWSIKVTSGNQPTSFENLGEIWLGEPLPCVLETVMVKKNDSGADPIVRYLPNGASSYTLMSLVFTEFETGTYVPSANYLWSKSEVSYNLFGFNGQ